MALNRKLGILALLAHLTAGCQTHLPSLETTPAYDNGVAHQRAPDIITIVDHAQCELATIVNSAPILDPATEGTPIDVSKLNPNVAAALARDRRLTPDLLRRLIDDHFVATLQFTLEVSDTEGLSPSLSFIDLYKVTTTNRTLSIGGQLTGTQDRSVTLSYTIDLAALRGSKNLGKYCAPQNKTVAQTLGLTGALAGDLGLEDVVSDGLNGVNATSQENQYATSGPANPPSSQEAYLSGNLTDLAGKSPIPITFVGTIVFTPPTTGGANPWTVNMNGIATVGSDPATSPQYMVSWTGSNLPNDVFENGNSPLSISGNLLPSSRGVGPLGFNSSVVLSGSVDPRHLLKSIDLSGVITPPPNGTIATPNITLQWDSALRAKILADIQKKTAEADQAQAAANAKAAAEAAARGEHVPAVSGIGGGAPGAKGATSASTTATAGSTSFGSLITFTLVYGLNGGPNWTLTNFKGPGGGSSTGSTGGGSQLLSFGRTNTDSLSITFVATCKNNPPSSEPSTVTDYWSSIPSCSTFDPSQRQAAVAAGVQNNLTMVLKNLSPSQFKQP